MRSLVRSLERWLKQIVLAVFRAILRSPPADFPPLCSFPRILIIRQHNQLGDMLCVVPLLRSIRAACPNVHLALMTSPVNRDIMLHNRYVNQVLVFDKQDHLRHCGVRIGNSLRYLRQLRSEKFDLAIVPSTVSTSLTSDFLAYLSGAPVRIGARSIDGTPNPSGFLFTHARDLNWLDTPDRHQTLRNADIMGPYAEHPEDLSHEITLLEEEEKWAIETLATWKKGRRLAVALHPGAGKPPNRWPADRFAELAGTLADEFNAYILITAGPMDGEEVRVVGRSLRPPYNTLLNNRIRVVASILRYVDLVVSNDTGIMHVAAGVGTPVLSLFGPTEPRQWAPLGGIHRYIKSETRDISEIPVQDVIRVAREMLLASGRGSVQLDGGQ